jgi:LuxR family maltose regulon positive regulatory protein
LAEPEDYLRAFLDYGESMQGLLTIALGQEITPGYVANLLAAFPAEAGGMTKNRGDAAHQPLVEPLTDQELTILRLMAAGLSHHEIATELYLSINTIKWHTMHIYGKLGVHRRAHAVARARDLSIL